MIIPPSTINVKACIVDVTIAEPQVAIVDAQQPLYPMRAKANTTLVQDMSTSKRSFKVATRAGKILGALTNADKSSMTTLQQVSVLVDEGNISQQNHLFETRLLPVILVAAEVAISRRVQR